MVRPWVFCVLLFPCSSAHSDSWMPLVNLTQRLLRDANSSFSSNCWVCLSIQTQRS
ncbi:rCG21358, partial [Rattus norvegicus]